MTLKDNIKAFSELGEILRDFMHGNETPFSSELNRMINDQQFKNPWFTPENVKAAIKANADQLTIENLNRWTSSYPALGSVKVPLKAGIVMAGNIPLVGFHDFLSVLISGNDLIAKTSSKDSDLIQYFGKILCDLNPDFRKRISFTEGLMTGFDVVIATGSDNSSRYFEYYFGKYPNIIRKNRNSIAVIDGNETDDELINLGRDIFLYFGLGCRNVSKIFIPHGYEIGKLIRNLDWYSGVTDNNKYANNYDFHKAVYLVNREPFLDTGYLLLKENEGLSSPVSVVYYEYYDSSEKVCQKTESLMNGIQCIVGRNNVPFGQAQSPSLWDYADGVDTIEFLLKKNIAGEL